MSFRKIRNGNCSKCGTWRQSLHRDHIVPKWKGGSNDPSNRQLLCANCHEDKTLEERKEFTPEMIERMRQPALGRKYSEEEKRRHKEFFTPEIRQQMSESAKKRIRQPHSEETKDKMRQAMLRRLGRTS